MNIDINSIYVPIPSIDEKALTNQLSELADIAQGLQDPRKNQVSGVISFTKRGQDVFHQNAIPLFQQVNGHIHVEVDGGRVTMYQDE